ncbi:MAG: hypothetical protein Tsb0017_24810 [Geothermobacteraceae bacterium]
MKSPRKGIKNKSTEEFVESDEHFAYIVGYTEGGIPYGITWEEARALEEEHGSSVVPQTARPVREVHEDFEDLFRLC